MGKILDSEKICFSSEHKANEFINNYSGEILQKRGFAPVRSYYSETCYSWHVTSKYLVASGYEKSVIAIYENECNVHLHNPHTLLQYENHKEDALLYAIDKDICDVIQLSLMGNYDETFSLIDHIRTNFSLCQARQSETSHKNRIAKFIACWSKAFSGKISRENSQKRFEGFQDYFSRKIGFYQMDANVQDDNILHNESFEHLSKLIKYFHSKIHKYYEYKNANDHELALIFLQDAIDISNKIAKRGKDCKSLSYKMKRVKSELHQALELSKTVAA